MDPVVTEELLATLVTVDPHLPVGVVRLVYNHSALLRDYRDSLCLALGASRPDPNGRSSHRVPYSIEAKGVISYYEKRNGKKGASI